VEPGETIFDLGTGSGVIPLILSGRADPAHIVAVEIQEELADMAKRTVLLNRLQGKIEIVPADVKQIGTLFPPCSCEVVTFNPPYRKLKSGRLNPNRQKAIARHEISGSLDMFVSAACHLLKPKGRCYLIYKVQRLPELFGAMRENGIEPKKMRLVYSRVGANADFVLMEGLKNGGEEMQVLPPLTIYERNGEYTSEMESIFDELEKGT
jgi:tRNA1Val (adenine37-N6)-methyltransferase